MPSHDIFKAKKVKDISISYPSEKMHHNALQIVVNS
jgi:hypothetical protein